MWTDAFIVYLSIYCSVHCEFFLGVLKYINTIRMAEKRCGPNNFGWTNYDEQFRLKIAGTPSTSWEEIDLEFWLIYVYSNTQADVQLNTRSQSIHKCYAFNYGGSCKTSNCTYGHCCLRCYGVHPLIYCNEIEVYTGYKKMFSLGLSFKIQGCDLHWGDN